MRISSALTVRAGTRAVAPASDATSKCAIANTSAKAAVVTMAVWQAAEKPNARWIDKVIKPYYDAAYAR